MNAKNVLNRIATLLSLDAKEVNFTDAKTKDGTILQSPTFDVGEDISVVSEDGTKAPAPDGEYELSLKDTEGKEIMISVYAKDGKITARENVEVTQPTMETEMADATTEEAKSLPNTTDESDANEIATPDTENPIISLGYRIDELEKAMTEMKSMFAEMKPKEEVVDKKAAEIATEKDVEMELPKLDGAPVEQINRFSQENYNNFGKKSDSPQASVLSKMYR